MNAIYDLKSFSSYKKRKFSHQFFIIIVPITLNGVPSKRIAIVYNFCPAYLTAFTLVIGLQLLVVFFLQSTVVIFLAWEGSSMHVVMSV